MTQKHDSAQFGHDLVYACNTCHALGYKASAVLASGDDAGG